MKHSLAPQLRMLPHVYYVWLGGSCDYNHPERAGGGACTAECCGHAPLHYTTAALHTTEFRMMLTVMDHMLLSLPADSSIVFLTNVAYLQNFSRPPGSTTANADLLARCRESATRHREVTVRLVSYHKYAQLPAVHAMAREAMTRLRTAAADNCHDR